MKSKKLVSSMMFICLLIFLINGISEKEEVVFSPMRVKVSK
ncbi:hypothetical protein AAHB47_30225 [Bacillus wiedmannii]